MGIVMIAEESDRVDSVGSSVEETITLTDENLLEKMLSACQ